MAEPKTSLGHDYPFYLGLSRTGEDPNLIPGHNRVNIRGFNDDIDAATTPEDLWGGNGFGGGLYPFQSGAVSVEIISDSANDDDGNTGANTVKVDGLDANLDPISETATMNGTNAVALSTQFYRINNMSVMTAGAMLMNVGNVRLRVASAGDTLCVIPAGVGLASHGIYTVRAGYTGYIVGSLFSLERAVNNQVNVNLFTRVSNVATSPWRRRWHFSLDSNGVSTVGFPTVLPHPMAAGTDIKTSVTYASANDVQVSTHLQMVLIESIT